MTYNEITFVLLAKTLIKSFPRIIIITLIFAIMGLLFGYFTVYNKSYSYKADSDSFEFIKLIDHTNNQETLLEYLDSVKQDTENLIEYSEFLLNLEMRYYSSNNVSLYLEQLMILSEEINALYVLEDVGNTILILTDFVSSLNTIITYLNNMAFKIAEENAIIVYISDKLTRNLSNFNVSFEYTYVNPNKKNDLYAYVFFFLLVGFVVGYLHSLVGNARIDLDDKKQVQFTRRYK